MGTVIARIPEELSKDIKMIEREEKTEQAQVIRKLLCNAVREWKLKKALEKLSGRITFRTATKLAGLTYVEMLDQVERAGIPITYSIEELQTDLAMLKKEK
jgi:predicted HTH domain antitoxin